MRPLDDHLVRGGEPALRGEHRPGVADGDPVAEEAADVRHRGGEVDGAEDQHPRARGERGHEHPHALAAPFAVGAVGQRLGAARGEQPAGVVGDRAVGTGRAEGPGGRLLGLLRPHDEPAAEPGRVGVLDDRGDGHRAAGRDVVGDGAELGEGLPRDRLDEDVEDAAAREPDGEGVVVGDAVPLEHRGAALDHLLRQLVDGPLDTATGDRADRLATRPEEHRGAGRPRRGAEGRDDGADADGLPGPPPVHQLVQDVTHARPPP